ncbi:hypothetical protein PPL_00857 [Heterostelium album PN500]|uniref:Uncharacterized protein n=1 Tax=Heterostelium pallidum (strain ATCC 26659 / Pp 5 / PN500) TaxID=670386 RepID=D3AYT8_HETP5|nr:hypothetical protein PPL_00857 [Heterostelium album PN500]EFA85628.1 hypothetical protein PPL_00857 [Heterostelium album PN500]|eukprot:XP_020437735.1 hypothetical protein PPL_00857 [Heterostelium album PN500]
MNQKQKSFKNLHQCLSRNTKQEKVTERYRYFYLFEQHQQQQQVRFVKLLDLV